MEMDKGSQTPLQPVGSKELEQPESEVRTVDFFVNKYKMMIQNGIPLNEGQKIFYRINRFKEEEKPEPKQMVEPTIKRGSPTLSQPASSTGLTQPVEEPKATESKTTKNPKKKTL